MGQLSCYKPLLGRGITQLNALKASRQIFRYHCKIQIMLLETLLVNGDRNRNSNVQDRSLKKYVVNRSHLNKSKRAP